VALNVEAGVNGVPVTIAGRIPDCPDCGAQLQAVPRGAMTVLRCPWVTEARWATAIGVTLASCDRPLNGDRDPNGIEPYGD
jgi:hypothetical protein